jgi:S1-C subfamily serine protease
MRRIILRHISGSKANQVDEFPVDQFKALTLGRDTDQTIHYDPERDDLVSKQHARIFCEEGHDDRFLITDLNSRNGTYVNKQRISGTASIVPGDVIQLGPGGPEFQFDLEPSPDGMLRATREAEPVRETRESVLSPRPSNSLAKPPVGYATVERMLSLYQQSSRRTFINLIAALVGVMVIVAGVLVYLNKREMGTRYANLGEKIKMTQDMVKVSRNTSPTDPTMSPAEIAHKFGPATVYIEVSWKLIHTKSDRQVYHRYDRGYPLYIQVHDRIFPWLSTDIDKAVAWPISNEHTGSGFVITSDGYIMTNRHVAAAWRTTFSVFRPIPSKLFVMDEKTLEVQYNPKQRPIEDKQELEELVQSANRWVPSNESLLLVEKREKNRFSVKNAKFEGRFEKLEVTFPKNRLRIPARLVRTSDQHDVALLRIDVPDSLPSVTVKDYRDSRPGDVITVLGYPVVSPEVKVSTRSLEPLNQARKSLMVPELTVTNGSIGRIIRSDVVPKGGAAYEYSSEVGDVIQLTVNATGYGNSGGPVFDDRGRVVGIFSYLGKQDVQISFAVPIRHGLEVMGLKSVLE